MTGRRVLKAPTSVNFEHQRRVELGVPRDQLLKEAVNDYDGRPGSFN